MQEAATIKFQDLESTDEIIAVVRYDEKKVALCLSSKSDGDIEVFMTKHNAGRLLEALAVALRKGGTP
jgi:hypothetical protein